jgi:hypothetical protein
MTMTHLMDFEECARAILPPHIFSAYYYAAAAGSGVGLDEGTADWSPTAARGCRSSKYQKRSRSRIGCILIFDRPMQPGTRR